MIYVVSDIHGEYEKFIQLTNRLSSSDKLYIIGDVVDRGPEPIKLIQHIMKMDNTVMLKGNHESMLLDYYYSNHRIYMKMGYSHNTTLGQLDKLSQRDQKKIVEYIEGLPLYAVEETKTGKYIMVHAGLNLTGIRDRSVEEILGMQSEEDLLWIREDFFEREGIEGYTIVFGHTPTASIRGVTPYNFDVWFDEIHRDKIGIDCGAVFSSEGGMLACLRLDDLSVEYI